jgi:putative colanic acid biosynthesis acetyltransferase WcaF
VASRPQVDLSQSRTPWSRKMKIKRLLWEVVQATLFRPTPKLVFWGWRAALLRLFGATLGEGFRIHGSVKVLMPWNLECGRNVVIGANVDLYNFAKVTIGDNAMVSQRTFLCTGSHDASDPTLPLIYQPIEIGAQAWVASEVFIGPGRRVGEGAVVAARSVVIKDIPDWMICAGHPCVPLKPRTLKETPVERRSYE